MFSSIGIPGLILILFVILLLFGPKKLPELGKSIGETLKNFKSSTRDMIEEAEAEAPKK